MNPDKIKIAPEREFEYEKISRTIDKMDDIDDVKLMIMLYGKDQMATLMKGGFILREIL